MDTSVYIALSRQLTKFDDMILASNNIANANTAGYNAEKMQFTQFLVDNGDIGKKDAYADTGRSYRDTSTGPIRNTGNPLDLAISGNGYFQIETPLGTRFTKAGNFQLDANNMLVTINGDPVLGADGTQITIPAGAKNIEINGVGQVSVDGNSVGQVGIMEFANEQSMRRLGNSLYSASETPQPAQTARVVQGAVEGSNVNGVTELVKVMSISREVGSTAKFIETIYDLERKTSTALAQKKQG